MITLPCNQPVFFDVDRTLVSWDESTPAEPDEVKVELDGNVLWLKAHRLHVDQVKAHKRRGHTTVVWSAGGAAWAEAVVLALGLQNHVDLVLEKPMWVYDDKRCCEFMPKSDFMPYPGFDVGGRK